VADLNDIVNELAVAAEGFTPYVYPYRPSRRAFPCTWFRPTSIPELKSTFDADTVYRIEARVEVSGDDENAQRALYQLVPGDLADRIHTHDTTVWSTGAVNVSEVTEFTVIVDGDPGTTISTAVYLIEIVSRPAL
jgi:hypothetical protein